MSKKILIEDGLDLFYINEDTLSFFRNGRQVDITFIEFRILWILCRTAGEVLSKKDLVKRIWPNGGVELRTLDVNIHRIRKLFNEKVILTKQFKGYYIKSESVEIVDH